MEQIPVNFPGSIFQALPSPLLSHLSCVSADMGTRCIMPRVGLTFRPFQLAPAPWLTVAHWCLAESQQQSCARGAAALGSMDAHQSLLFWSAPHPRFTLNPELDPGLGFPKEGL